MSGDSSVSSIRVMPSNSNYLFEKLTLEQYIWWMLKR